MRLKFKSIVISLQGLDSNEKKLRKEIIYKDSKHIITCFLKALKIALAVQAKENNALNHE